MKCSKNNLGNFIGNSARLIKYSMNNRLRELGYDLTMEHLIFMKILNKSDGMTQQGIADFFSKDKGSITRMVSNMEDRNLLMRIPDKVDKRCNLIYLTPHGRKMLTELFQVIQEFNDHLVEDIPDDELIQCLSVLEKIIIKLSNKNVVHTTNNKLEMELCHE